MREYSCACFLVYIPMHFYSKCWIMGYKYDQHQWMYWTVFQSGCISLHYSPHETKDLGPAYFHQMLEFLDFLTLANPTAVLWYLTVLFCILFMTNNADHLFICWLAIWISFLVTFLFNLLPSFKKLCCLSFAYWFLGNDFIF